MESLVEDIQETTEVLQAEESLGQRLVQKKILWGYEINITLVS
jgi:hypothetical protein